MNFINLEGGSDRLGGGEMSVVDGIKCPTQYGNLHVRRDSNTVTTEAVMFSPNSTSADLARIRT